MHDELSQEICIPCQGGVPPLTAEEIRALAAQVGEWAVVDNRRIERTWTFSDFAGALRFVVAVGAIAEAQGHHPEIQLAWGRVTVQIETYKVQGLTRSDFILAARIDRDAHDAAS